MEEVNNESAVMIQPRSKWLSGCREKNTAFRAFVAAIHIKSDECVFEKIASCNSLYAPLARNTNLIKQLRVQHRACQTLSARHGCCSSL